MKNFFILILCFNLTTLCLGQNWDIMNIHSYNHYKNSSTNKYSNSLKVDSFKLEGADSIFFLNLICSARGDSFEYFVYNYKTPQFLNKQIRKTDSTCYFYLPDTFQIKSNVSVGDSWTFHDTTIARVVFNDTQTIMHTLDSIRIIVCGSIDTIIVSKNHGIIRFDDIQSNQSYSLIGSQNDSNAFQLPSYKDFYNYEIGDEFCYYETHYFISGMRLSYKIKILNKYVYPDRIVYWVQNHSLRCVPGPPIGDIICSSSVSYDSMVYSDTSFPALQANRTLLKLPYYGSSEGYTIINYSNDTTFFRLDSEPNRVGGPVNDSIAEFNNSAADGRSNNLSINTMYGYITSRNDFTDVYIIENLQGYHGSREYGSDCLSDSAYIHASVLEPVFKNTFIFPTLVKDQVSIINDLNDFNLDIYDFYGQHILATHVNNNSYYKLDFSSQLSGVYLLQISTPTGQRMLQKIVKQ